MNHPSTAWHAVGWLEPSFAEVAFTSFAQSTEFGRERLFGFGIAYRESERFLFPIYRL